MTIKKVELHLTATVTKWGNVELRYRTVTRGEDGKVASSDSNEVASYSDRSKRKAILERELGDFWTLYRLLQKEKI